jgi:hypothetical protein
MVVELLYGIVYLKLIIVNHTSDIILPEVRQLY